MEKFKSFVSIDLNDYNELIIGSVAQEEKIIDLEEKIVELEEKNDAHKGLLIYSWKNYLIHSQNFSLRRLVEEPNEKDYVEYHKEALFKELSRHELPVSIITEIIDLALEEVKKIIEEEQKENKDGN